MVLTGETLMSFDCLLDLKLDFGEIRSKFNRNLVNHIRSESEMGPPCDVLLLFVLEFVLPSLVKMVEFLSDMLGSRLVPNVI